MDLLLLTIALLLLLWGGLGLTLLLLPDRPTSAAELFALSFLFGSSIVSASSFVLGFSISGGRLRWSAALLCVAIGVIGIWRRGLKLPLSQPRGSKWMFALATAQVAVVAWLNYVRVLGWDGLFNFESKARMAFLNGGTIPMEFFSDPSRSWMLQSYPMMLPLTESWLYLWMGREDQQLMKILFPLFFVAALALVNTGNRLLQISLRQRLIAPALMFAAPLLLVGDGSVSSGYADFPLGVFYLAAAIYLLEFWRSQNHMALRLAGAISACGCWLKQEGAILWFCIVVIAAITLKLKPSSRRDWVELAKAAVPGLLIVFGWQLFVRTVGLPEIRQFSSLDFATLSSNLPRIPLIAVTALAELANLRDWGVIWLVYLGATVWMLYQRKLEGFELMPLFVLLPLGLYPSIYLFSIWPSVETHMKSSFPRLLLHVSLVSAFLGGAATRFGPPIPTSRHSTKQ